MKNPSQFIVGTQIGHCRDMDAATGCTVILCPEGAVCGVDQRGGAPGTRETDLLRPMHLVEKVHAVMLSGGSAYGLSAADGVMRWLEKHGYGFDVGEAKVPIVPAASLFDLAIGKPDVRPDSQMGYAACEAAIDDWFAQTGTVGAGTGATVGHLLGDAGSMKGGLGTSIIEATPGIFVGAIFAVNCFGDVKDPKTGKTIAGTRVMPSGEFADTLEALAQMPSSFDAAVKSTVIGVVATNATLSKETANKVAQMAHNGLARTIVPAHTMFDGDTIFAMATGHEKPMDANIIGTFAAEATAQAVIDAVTKATSLCGVIAMRDLAQP
jgi:L-aminopeptidase/D-esterase-like protein